MTAGPTQVKGWLLFEQDSVPARFPWFLVLAAPAHSPAQPPDIVSVPCRVVGRGSGPVPPWHLKIKPSQGHRQEESGLEGGLGADRARIDKHPGVFPGCR